SLERLGNDSATGVGAIDPLPCRAVRVERCHLHRADQAALPAELVQLELRSRNAAAQSRHGRVAFPDDALRAHLDLPPHRCEAAGGGRDRDRRRRAPYSPDVSVDRDGRIPSDVTLPENKTGPRSPCLSGDLAEWTGL